MKRKSVLWLAAVSGGIVLVLGALWLRPWPLATTETTVTSALVAGPLRHLPATSAGRVWEMYVQTGSVVKRGQLLAKVAVPLHTVSQQQAEVELRQALHLQEQLNNAAPYEKTEVAIAQTRQRIAAIRQRLAAMPRQLTFVYVQAPANGTVVRLPVNTGTYVADSTTLISLGVTPPPTEGVAQN
ncbi:efflux RND transporter periplasmic adaptor subunit [Hymenobacter sp. BT186]|uniref:Efflux RND transporter periplasmic adaptor subunit n=1 Tax=Hymenobacter telluris TaxID=2816474 RepID=A0A939JEH2_9BACT|nr:efflux RND transporter periplasmic adaptor subunit [Hymenobacter telluris]MBO0359382.1 efflux RND transporter periplasmic adaptor subunit [Hymenobacter telluris]MBW3375408.1 efflux RND transporter periplasmic adaptor subunit [Hymenobacter norwichensis]